MIEVEAPDGTIVEFPDGTPDAVMEKAMREAYGAPNAAGKTDAAPDDGASGAYLPGMGAIEAFGRGLYDIPILGPALNQLEAAKYGAYRTGAGIAGLAEPTTFGEARQSYLDRGKQLAAENPLATMGGNLAGSMSVMAPIGATSVGGRALGIVGKNLLSRTGASIASGAAISGADKAARGGDKGDIARSAITGGLISGVMPALGTGLNWAGRSIGAAVKSRYGALFNPTKEAARRVGKAIDIDRASGQGLLQADEAVARLNQQPVRNLDRGGETTRALIRSSANQDPDARAAVARLSSDRFEGQGSRAKTFLQRLMHGATDDVHLQDALRQTAKSTNRAAYRAAYKQGANIKLTPELERLTGSPAIVRAMKEVATGKGRDRAIAQGYGSFNPGVRVTEDGRIIFQNAKPGSAPTFPDLQFWDYVKQELDDAAMAAARNGRRGEADALGNLARTLRGELDKQVPQYAAARAGAARFFGAEDAIEAGRNFNNRNISLNQAAKALDGMTPQERTAFAVGFASDMKKTIENTRDRTNVIDRLFGNEASREKIRLALGDKAFNEFEQFVRVENVMDMLRGALGNSTTARQLAELGLAGSVGTGAGILTGDWQTGLTTAVAVRAGRAIGAATMAGANERVSKRIMELLLSDNPQDIQKAVQMATMSPQARQAIQAMERYLAGASRGAAVAVGSGTE